MEFHDFIHCGIEFFPSGFVDGIGKIVPDHLLICWDHHHIQIVNLFKFSSFSISGTRHARQFVVHSKIILECHRRQCLVFIFNPYSLFGFQGLVQPLAIPTPRHQPAGELVDDNNFAIFDDIIDIPLEKSMCL